MSGYFTDHFEKIWRQVTVGNAIVTGTTQSSDEATVIETDGPHPSQPEEPTIKLIAKFNWSDFKTGDVVEAFPDVAFDEVVWIYSTTEKRLVAFHISHFTLFQEVNL
jgi:hypothetical protein